MFLSVAFIKHSSTVKCKMSRMVQWGRFATMDAKTLELAFPFWVIFIVVPYIFSDIGSDQLIDRILVIFDIGKN